MAAFLDIFAGEIIRRIESQPDQYGVVLPNRRAGLFLKRFLAGHLTKPAWLPAIFSIEDFILFLSGYRLIDPVALIFELYQAHMEVEGKEAQPFDEFISWGRELLNDFNEIDQYLVDPQKLFSHLSDAKAISLWNLDNEPLTPFQQKYLRFYRSLERYYAVLSGRLISSGQVYQGLAYRQLARRAGDKTLEIPWKKVFFGGFNALTPAEEKIIGYLAGKDQAEIFWDADTYYMDNADQEAGAFLRNYRNNRTFGPFQWTNDHFRDEDKKIHVVGVPRNIGQVKKAGEILSKAHMQSGDSLRTALVLMDENLLLPVLNSIPEEAGEFNITMGYPLKYTPVFDLIDSIFVLNENAERFYHLSGKENWRYYYKDVFRVLNHPYMMALAGEAGAVQIKIGELGKSNFVFYKQEQLAGKFSGVDPEFAQQIGIVFEKWDQGSVSALACFARLLDGLHIKFISLPDEGNDRIGLEYLYHFAGIISRIRSILARYPVINDIRTLRGLISQLARFTSIPFYGEPLKGLQIMGMLETRTLDFENLILLSVNDDLIPAGKKAHSFIPYDIKVSFGLPTYKEHDAVFAYHFYRLLQRVREAWIIFNTEPTELGGGEQSRFITQLLCELPKYNPKITIERELVSIPTEISARDFGLTVEKSAVHLKILLQLAEKGFSPSSLNAYRNCTLQFYFHYIAGLKEDKEVEETIDAATLGTVMHKVMRIFYEPYEQRVLRPNDIDPMIEQVDELASREFKRLYPDGEMKYGKNLLIVNIAKVLLRNYLSTEREYLQKRESAGFPLTIIGIEQMLKTEFQVRYGNETIQVAVQGTADRIDRTGDTYRIIDYKTGNVRPNDLTVKEWENLQDDPALAKSFQVLVYGYLFRRSQPSFACRIEPGIVSFRTPNSGLMSVTLPEKALLNDISLDHFGEVILGILEQIFDREVPFKATGEVENCEYCPYKPICYR